jgi:hypothetical protein
VTGTEEMMARAWENLVGRIHGPMTFRLVLQPIAAAILAMRAGVRDARGGRRAYFWAMLRHPHERRELLREGWKDVAKVFTMAIVIDAVYQVVVLRWLYPGEALIVAAVLAILPYLVIRGLVSRIMRAWHGGARAPGLPGLDSHR